METKKQNDLSAENKWNSMSYKERSTFMTIQGLHSIYIKNNVGKRFKDLASRLKLELKTYKIPKNTDKKPMAKRDLKQKAAFKRESGKKTAVKKESYSIEISSVIDAKGNKYSPSVYAGIKHKDLSKEQVNHPSHYGGAENPYEVIKVIRAFGLNFALGNSLKYIARAGKKDPDKTIEDLKKAAWYLNDEIKTLEEEKAKKTNNK